MLGDFPFYIILILIIVLTIVLANKIKVAYPILLVIIGLIVGFVPGAPTFQIDPDLIFFIFLPPLLFESAWGVSWKQMWRWRRIITSFAFIIVFITASAFALLTSSIIPGFTLALGFLLGAVVSPPDAVSAGAILKFVKVPKRVSSLLEGESLFNDASALIILKFAILAVITGQFVWTDAILSFVWMIVGGVGVGLLVGYLFMELHKSLTTDININIILTFITPYVMYVIAEEIGASGVLSVVGGGLLMSAKRAFFLNASSRIRGLNVWDNVILVFNGLVFTIVGLELPDIIHGLQEDGTSITKAIIYGVITTFILIIVRILSSYGTVGFTLIASKFITVADARNPGYKIPLLVGWSGMRGVVSLAAALSIPVSLTDGTDFPYRNLILFITFIVILLTLLIQGLTLPTLINKLQIVDPDKSMTEKEEYKYLQMRLAIHTLKYLEEKYTKEIKVDAKYQELINKMKEDVFLYNIKQTHTGREHVYFDILEEQRRWLRSKNKELEDLSEEVVKRSLYYIDLEEEKLKFE